MPQQQNTPISREQLINSHLDNFSNVLEPLSSGLTADLKKVLLQLYLMRDKCPKATFHLFLETELPQTEVLMPATQLRVAYSPTIDPTAHQTRDLVQQATGILSIISAVSKANQKQQGSFIPFQQSTYPIPQSDCVLVPPQQLLQQRSPGDKRDLRLFNSIHFPDWYPGQENTPNVSNNIQILAATFEKFPSETNKAKWLYDFFFTQLKFAATTKAPQYKFHGNYEQFSAPWLSGRFNIQGITKSSVMTKVEPLRKLRNQSGVEQIRMTLAAFYDNEPLLCQGPMDYMLKYTNELMGLFPIDNRSRVVSANTVVVKGFL